MQTKIKILLPVIVLFMSAAATAQQVYYTATVNNNASMQKKTPSFSLAIVPDKVSTAFGLYVDNPRREKIQLQISHRDNGVLVDTSFTGQFNQRYNFELADDGPYVVTLVSGKDKISKAVEINTIATRIITVR